MRTRLKVTFAAVVQYKIQIKQLRRYDYLMLLIERQHEGSSVASGIAIVRNIRNIVYCNLNYIINGNKDNSLVCWPTDGIAIKLAVKKEY